MSVLHLKDLTWYYEESGTGTPVLLIHGHPFDCTMWRSQLAAGIAAHLIAPDLRNFGRTTSPNGPANWSTYAQDLLDLMDNLGVQRFAAAGLSMGGQIALELFALAPDRIVGLALCDTSAPLDTPQKHAGRLALAERLEREGMDTYADEVLPKLLSSHTIQTRPEIAHKLLEMMKSAPPLGAAAASRMRTERRDYVPLLAEVQVPTLITVGELDQFTPIPDAELMHKAIAGSELVVIPEAGHVTNLEQPAIFNHALGEWANRL